MWSISQMSRFRHAMLDCWQCFMYHVNDELYLSEENRIGHPLKPALHEAQLLNSVKRDATSGLA